MPRSPHHSFSCFRLSRLSSPCGSYFFWKSSRRLSQLMRYCSCIRRTRSVSTNQPVSFMDAVSSSYRNSALMSQSKFLASSTLSCASRRQYSLNSCQSCRWSITNSTVGASGPVQNSLMSRVPSSILRWSASCIAALASFELPPAHREATAVSTSHGRVMPSLRSTVRSKPLLCAATMCREPRPTMFRLNSSRSRSDNTKSYTRFVGCVAFGRATAASSGLNFGSLV